MSIHLKLPPPRDLNPGTRPFVELYGGNVVLNTYLKIAVIALSVTCVGVTVLLAKAVQALGRYEPTIIRINDIGRAEAVSRAALEYKPEEPEIKYFLIRFVQEHYGRIRATVKEDFATSLSFLDAALANAIIEAEEKNKSIEQTLAGAAEEIDIKVTGVAIEDLRKAPYRATVDYEKIYYSPSGRREVRREKFVGNFVFVVRGKVPNSMIPVNPLGLTITYFREDQAFQ